jgi:predicted cupin superfamily sugar epimerase
MNEKVKFYLTQLNLKPHPEGGYFREVYRSDETVQEKCLPERYGSKRSFATSIYFLLEGEQTSKFHQLKSDEQWYFYDGCAISIYIINEQGELSIIRLGRDMSNSESFQTVIKRNH